MSLGILWERFCDGFKAVTEILSPRKQLHLKICVGKMFAPSQIPILLIFKIRADAAV